jgi:hypothetical protein
MEVAGAEDGGEEEDDADATVQSGADDTEEEDLGEGTDNGQEVADEVELGDLGALGEETADVADNGVEADVEPASDGIFGVVFPRLEPVAVGEIVGGLVVIEGLVAVLDGGEDGGDYAGDEEAVEGGYGLDRVRAGGSVGQERSAPGVSTWGLGRVVG